MKMRAVPKYLLAVLIAPVIAFGGFYTPAEAKAKKPQADLPNFHQVYPFLYRGGEPSQPGVRKLHQMGIRTVIDLRAVTKKSRAERALAESLGMKYIQLPMSDEPPTKYQVDTFLAHADKAKAGGPKVFLHCQHGSDRTGSMMGIYRVTRDGWNYNQAYKEMRKYWFTPKFTKLSGAVRQYAAKQQ